MDTIRMYGHYVRSYALSVMQYRISFWTRLVATLLQALLEVVGVWVLFGHFRVLGTWTFAETLLMFAVASMAFGFAEWFGRGFDKFPAYVAAGDFDVMLVRPRSTVLQVLGTRFEVSKIGRVLQGALLAAWCLQSLGASLTPAKWALLAAAVVGGTFVYIGVFVLFATLSFWTIQSVELAYILTNLSLDFLQYPIEIYGKWFQRFFTFAVPLAAVTYYPMVAILAKPDLTHMPVWFHWLAPALGPLFLAAMLRFWHFGVRHYHSTGS